FFLALASGWFLDHREESTPKQERHSFYFLLFFTVFLSGAVLFQFLQPIALLPVVTGWGMAWLLKKEKTSKRFYANSLILLVILNMAGNNMVYYYPPGKNTMASRVPYGTAEESYASLFDG